MKALAQISLVFFCLTAVQVVVQGQGGLATLELPSFTYNYDYALSISDVQTTTLIFPNDVVSVDRGTPDVLTQTLEEVTNIVKVKAAFEGIDYSSLTVITTGGMVYTFRIGYDQYPAALTYNLNELRPPADAPPASVAAPVPTQFGYYSEASPPVWNIGYHVTRYLPQTFLQDSLGNAMDLEFAHTKVSGAFIQQRSRQIALAGKQTKRIRRDRAEGSELTLNDIWIEGDIIYYRFTLDNPSTISYDVDFWRFFIVDAKAAKRTAVQERDVEILSVLSTADEDRVEANSSSTYVVAFNKFTIPDKKILALELFEKNGGRHHRVEVKNRHIVGALPVR